MTDVGDKKGKIEMNKNNLQQKQPSCLVASPETNHSPLTIHYSLKRKVAFTLAEVLITLGIIGIVAALTLPNLIEQHEKKATAVKLEKFYSIMSQAVLRWQTEEGISPESFSFPQEAVRNKEETTKWYNENLKPYINQETDTSGDIYTSVKFNDGSGFVAYIAYPNVMHFFYCTQIKYCAQESYDGRRTFLFSLINGRFYPSVNESVSNRAELLDKCKHPFTNSYHRRHSCTQLIQYDGWQIKDDYPWREE